MSGTNFEDRGSEGVYIDGVAVDRAEFERQRDGMMARADIAAETERDAAIQHAAEMNALSEWLAAEDAYLDERYPGSSAGYAGYREGLRQYRKTPEQRAQEYREHLEMIMVENGEAADDDRPISLSMSDFQGIIDMAVADALAERDMDVADALAEKGPST